jgi:hypothetical protein
MDWKEALTAARSEHRELIQQRDVIDAAQADLDLKRETLEKRILQLEQTIASLSELTGEGPLSKAWSRAELNKLDSLKLADALRKVLQSGNKYWTPIDVRDMLLLQGYDLSGYTNPLASIHAVLKRLHESGETVRIASAEGKAMYRWKSIATTVPQREFVVPEVPTIKLKPRYRVGKSWPTKKD